MLMRPGRDADHPPPSTADVKYVELYVCLFSLSVLYVTGQIFVFCIRLIWELYLITEVVVGLSALQFRILGVPGSYIISYFVILML
jgi:hypothetical protein